VQSASIKESCKTYMAQLPLDVAQVLALGQAHEREEARDDDGRASKLVKSDSSDGRRDGVSEVDLLQHLEPFCMGRRSRRNWTQAISEARSGEKIDELE
jgi:hypothetical protein